VGEDIAHKCAEKNTDKYKEKVLIDLGADFRLDSEEDYEKWYKGKYKFPEYHKNAVYGLTEHFREDIKKAQIIANPGCYPTSIGLALYPLLKNKLTDVSNIIIDSKSGVTGAGRGLTQNTHFPDTNEAFGAYKAAEHRHTPEIEQTLRKFADGDKNLSVTFVPHLLPVNRGIESSIYCKLNKNADLRELHGLFTETYKNEYFVRILPLGEYANISYVRLSNFCDISLHLNKSNNTLILSSCIDNLVKGAAGQAVQNMNVRFGINEREGLDFAPTQF
jgi:N-acetyl-gamma-glutamyl-phosphate reductase